MNWRELFGRIKDWFLSHRSDHYGEDGGSSTVEPDEGKLSEYTPEEVFEYFVFSEDAPKWDDRATDVFMRRTFGDADLTPDMIRQVDDVKRRVNDDRDRSIGEQREIEDRLERAGEHFWKLFTDDEIEAAICGIEHDLRTELFALEEIVSEMDVDRAEFVYEYPVDYMEAQVQMEDEPLSRSTVDYETRSVEMMNVAFKIDIRTDVVTDAVREKIRTEAGMLWDAMDVDQVGGRYGQEEVFEAIESVREHYYEPRIAVVNGDRHVDEFPGLAVVHDETGAMTVPFVVAHEDVGYRLTASPTSLVRLNDFEPVFAVKWTGNYAIPNTDAFAVPSE